MQSRSKAGVLAFVLLVVLTACGGGSTPSNPPPNEGPPDAGSSNPRRPGVPRDLAATPGDRQVVLTWTAPSDTGGAALGGYVVTVSSTGAQPRTVSGAASPLTVAELTNGTEYAFTVAATNSAGTGAASTAVTATPFSVPGAPADVVAQAGNREAVVTWTAPADDGGRPITGYVVTAQPGGLFVTVAASERRATLTGLTNGTEYTFTVAATNTAGTGAVSVASQGVVPKSVPGVPTELYASEGDASAVLTWRAPDASGSPILRYLVKVFDMLDNGGTLVNTQEVAGSPATITGLTNGGLYRFTVTAENAVGQGPESERSNEMVPVGLPTAPRNVRATAGNRRVLVEWMPPEYGGGVPTRIYRVRGYAAGTLVRDISTIGTSLDVTDLANGTAYQFAVSATSSAGEGPAAPLTDPVIPRAVPSMPRAVVATPGNGQVSLSWAAPQDDGGNPVTLYTVRVLVGSTVQDTRTTTGTSLIVGSLSNGTAYGFTVAATNSEGQGLPSAVVQATPRTVPDVPQDVQVSRGDGQIQVTWAVPLGDGGSPITHYTVRAYIGSTVARTQTSSTTSATVTGLTNGTAYTFRVSAHNAAGEGPASAATASIQPGRAPTAPQNLVASPGNQEVVLTWSAPADIGGLAISRYVVRTSSGGSLLRTGFVTTTTASIGVLNNGQAYTFTVSAENAAGEGPTVGPVTATPRTVPGAPTGISTTPGNQQVTVSWTAPTVDGGSPVTGYSVQVYSSTGTPLRTQASSTTSATVTGLTNGTGYLFAVRAVNAAGEGPLSPQSGTTTPRTVPGAPRNVTATPGNSQVVLAWVAPADNGGAAISGYTVTLSAGGSVVRTESASASPLTLTGLTNGTEYGFTVSATNTAGTGAATAPVLATPRTVPGAPRNVTAMPGNSQVVLAWAAPADNGGAAISGYTVTLSAGGSVVRTESASASPLTLTGLTNGTAYTLTVAAENVAGRGPAAGPAEAVIPFGPPSAPQRVRVAALGRRVAVKWDAPANDGGRAPSRYTVTSSPAGVQVSVAGTETSAVVDGLPLASGYTFTVVATNAAGPGAASAPSAAVDLSCESVGFPGGPLGQIPRAASLALLDLDADNRAEVIVGAANEAGEAQVQVWRRSVDGALSLSASYPVARVPDRLAVVDVDGDTFKDLVGARTTFPELMVLRGRSGGTFAPAVTVDSTGTGHGFAVGDLNRDGRPDLVASHGNAASVLVMLGNGDGSFQAATSVALGVAPRALAVADFNRDGNPDVAVSTLGTSGALRILPGNGQGAFGTAVSVPATGNGGELLAVDLHQDGWTDLVVAGNTTNDVALLRNLADGTFAFERTTRSAGTSPAWMAAGDLDGNGLPDVVIPARTGGRVSVVRSRAGGTYESSVSYVSSAPGFAAVADLDADGRLDVATLDTRPNPAALLDVLRGRGDGTLESLQLSLFGTIRRLRLGDLNDDGRLDAVYNNHLDTTMVRLGNGDGTFGAEATYTSGNPSYATELADLNGDGRDDVIVFGWSAARVAVLLASADGSLPTRTFYSIGGTGHSGSELAVGDINNDGRQDVAVALTSPDRVSVLMGTAGGGFAAPVILDSNFAAIDLSLADINRDGRADLIAANPSMVGVTVRLAQANGTLGAPQSYMAAPDPVSSFDYSVGDANGDGWLDIVATGTTLRTLLNDQAGGFQAPVASPIPTSWVLNRLVDINTDGRLDLVAHDSGGIGTAEFLLGFGDGTFGRALALYPIGGSTLGLSALNLGNINGDDRLDMVAGQALNTLVVMPQVCR
jgi:hypothetical protein